MSDELDKVDCTIMAETDKAFRLRNREGKEAWFPKSQVSFARRNIKTGQATIEAPEWLLRAKGW